jgi:hypothetical protein
MKEIYEFRVREKYAERLFGPRDGKRLGDITATVRKIELTGDDPKLKRVGELNAEIQRDHNDLFFTGWNIHRRYTVEELQKGELILLHRFRTFEPAGEEGGTQYEESSGCKQCRSGARQMTPLFLDWDRIPKGRHFARTIAGEIVVSRQLMELFRKDSVTGAEFQPIRSRPVSSAESKDWFQLIVTSCGAEVSPQTRTGVNPFDEDAAREFRCPRGDLIGLARLSEVWIKRSSYSGYDIVASRQFIGARRGLLRPERLLLISPRLRRIIADAKVKGYKLEVAHLVD